MGATLNGRQGVRLVTRGRGSVAGGVAKRQKIRTGAGKVDPPCSNASRFPMGSMTVGGGVTQTLHTPVLKRLPSLCEQTSASNLVKVGHLGNVRGALVFGQNRH